MILFTPRFSNEGGGLVFTGVVLGKTKPRMLSRLVRGLPANLSQILDICVRAGKPCLSCVKGLFINFTGDDMKKLQERIKRVIESNGTLIIIFEGIAKGIRDAIIIIAGLTFIFGGK